MKAPLLIFCTILVIDHFVIAYNEFPKSSIHKDSYPKKYPERIVNGPKMLNSRRVSSKLNGGIIKKIDMTRTKKPNGNSDRKNEYTVFPTHHKKQPIDVPSSPYFSPDIQNDEPKLRVKKVLPDFWNIHSRKKRTPDEAVKGETKEDESNKAKITADEVTKKTEAAKEGHEAAKPVEEAAKPVEKATKPVAEVAKKAENSGDLAKTSKGPKITAKKTANATVKPKSRLGKSKNNVKPAKSSAARNKKAKKPAAKRSKPSATRKLKRKLKQDKKSKRLHSKNKKKNTSDNVKRNNKKGKESRRLIAGRDAMIEDYPYVVSIQKNGEHWCAGALLNKRLVITTANCVWKSNRMSRMKIRAGSRHLEHGGQEVQIAEVLKHPSWSIRKNPDNDVALLLMDSFVKFSHSCHAVDLPNRAMMPVFEDAWVTSWGAERRDGVYIKQGLTLQAFHARLMERDKCNNVTMRFGVIVTDNFICLEQIGRRAPCTRDTGAPAVSDGVLWGLASWGIRKMCGTERFPAMFSYIASETNMDFIINGTKYLMSEKRLSPFLDRYSVPRARDHPAGS